MNKSHRVIWSSVRNCFVVASETAKSKGKTSSTRKAVAAAVAALFLTPGLVSAACSGITPLSAGLTTGQCYSDQDITINNTGSIAVPSGSAVYVSASPYTKTFTNKGTLSSNGQTSSALVVFNSDVSGSIVNNGTINVNNQNGNRYATGLGIYGSLLSSGKINNTGSINTTVNNSNTSAYAYGVYVSNDLAGSLINSGQIKATAIAGSSSASAYGVYVGNNLSGTLTNSGTISAKANVYSSSYANAYGVYVGGDLSGSLVNTSTGTISASAKNTYSYTAYAYGVYTSGNLSGSLSNAGTISATADANTSYAYAYGVYIGNDLSGSLTNTGKITATASVNTDSSAYAYGVYANQISGTLKNSGTISATATNHATSGQDAYAYGIYTNGITATGSIINSGTIQASAIAAGKQAGGGYGYGSAYGIYVNGTVDGLINNSGTISALVDVLPGSDYLYGTAYGIYASNGLSSTGSISNTGTIKAEAHAYGTSYPYAYGIYMSGNVDGSINNSGTISATAVGQTSAYAYGIYLNSNLNGTLVNSGTISATANAVTNSYASAYGIYESGTLAGSITNTGTISASAKGGTNSYASAYGIYANTVNGTISNSGTISAKVSGGSASASNYAYGIYAFALNGTINNSGVISATGANSYDNDYNSYSILSYGGTGIVNNLAGGILDGRVILYNFIGGAINLNNSGDIRTRLGSSYVSGDYTQSATGIFTLAALDTSTYGYLYAAGTATLAANSTIRVEGRAGNTIAAGDVLTNVISAGTLSMSTPINVQDTILAVNFTAADNGSNGVDLTAAATGLSSVVSSVQAAGLSSAAGAATVLDNMLANPSVYSPEVINYLYAIGSSTSNQEVANKTAQLLPLASGNISNSTLNTLRLTTLAVGERQDGNLGASSGDLNLTDKHFWLKPFGGWANQDKRSGTLGYDANSSGLIVGADGELSDTKNVGIAFAYARTNVDTDVVNQDANIKSYQGTFYGSYKFDDVTSLTYQIDLGYHDTDGKRNIVGVGAARSDYDSWSGHAGVGLAKRFNVDEVTTFTPSIRADYSRIRAEGYREKGAGAFNLKVASDTTEELILGVDGKLARNLSEKATAYANLGLGYDVINDRASITSSFAGVPNSTFTTKGIDPSPWLVRGGLGVTGHASETLDLSLRYDFEVRNDFDNQTASVNARWAF